jgi:hypothetical protein
VTFSAILLAIKWTSDCSHTNLAFVRRTPWSLSEINAMEKEMLSHLKYDIYISAAEYVPCLLPFPSLFFRHSSRSSS